MTNQQHELSIAEDLSKERIGLAFFKNAVQYIRNHLL
jgi:hypothetical protein